MRPKADGFSSDGKFRPEVSATEKENTGA